MADMGRQRKAKQLGWGLHLSSTSSGLLIRGWINQPDYIQSWARDNSIALREQQRDKVIEPQGVEHFQKY